MHLGAPDIGLVTMSEIQHVVASVADAVSIPIIVDIDTGFGNSLNTIRTVRAFERAGAAGLQIEDQVFPKRCGHFSGKEVVSVGDRLASFEERQRVVQNEKYDRFETLYTNGSTAADK